MFKNYEKRNISVLICDTYIAQRLSKTFWRLYIFRRDYFNFTNRNVLFGIFYVWYATTFCQRNQWEETQPLLRYTDSKYSIDIFNLFYTILHEQIDRYFIYKCCLNIIGYMSLISFSYVSLLFLKRFYFLFFYFLWLP